MATAVGLSKVFILDKYFTELTKYWQTERQLQDATSNEAVHLQQQLKNLSSELVTLRTRLRISPVEPNGNPNEQALKPCSPSMGSKTRKQEYTYNEVNDLIHLLGPLTEDSLLRALHSRFMANQYYTNVGPVLLSINHLKDRRSALTLNSTHMEALECTQLLRIVHEAVRQHNETGYPQAIILSGVSGSGKTYSSMIILRQLFNVAGGGPETDTFKHLTATFTVLRSLESAKTQLNSESSRLGHFIEVQVTDGALYRTKIHCYFLDQSRVVKTLPNEKNYHIFYQMLAGLTPDERTKLNLDGMTVESLQYLNKGNIDCNDEEDAIRFEAWKSCLSVLGIPFLDVVRVLAAVLLLGNITFNENQNPIDSNNDCKHSFSNEVKAVASLLGVSSVSLYRGFTTRTQQNRGQLLKSHRDSQSASATRDAFAKALYCRTVATIIRRANSSKRIGSSCGTISSDSNESIHNHTETGSHHTSSIGSNGAKSHKSMNVLNSAVRHATDGFIGILDMFGFEDAKPSHLEQLCINLCSETMQHFYNTHIFKSSIESCREEGVKSDIEIDYVDNVPCIDFISSLRTGLFSLLDAECSLKGTPVAYVQKIKAQHLSNSRYFEVPINRDKSTADQLQQMSRQFGIRHYAGNVTYNTINFLESNSDRLSDDVISIFHKSLCTFGFVSHLFGVELKLLYNKETVPRGLNFRIAPTAHVDIQNGFNPVTTLTQDFHTRLDNLLRTLVHARPHFIRCIKANDTEQPNYFDRGAVVRQIRALQVLETVNLMAGGLPHRMRFKAFNSRYRLLAPFKLLKRVEDKAIEDCKLILDCFIKNQKTIDPVSGASTTWALGKRHIFLSEGARQQLEMLRNERRMMSAVLIQSTWKGWNFRRRWPLIRQSLLMQNVSSKVTANTTVNTMSSKPRPLPITGTPPPFGTCPQQNKLKSIEICDQNVIQETCTLFGIDLNIPPPVPPSRSYTITGNAKLGYPQTRVMKMDYPESGPKMQLEKGQRVTVVGASTKRGHLLVDNSGITLTVPYQFLVLIPTTNRKLKGSVAQSDTCGVNI
ncbi:uncharacterized protein LOC128957868 [Oppia nitens]|uniref:uncharacterized protein LOC128957868 n=1 Tax=Oppia nitens TaxID=1686743 RepID=UPI0023D9EBB6|nr:uncharacterized protein LOC128957868 [Oppia nitens]